MPNKHHLFYTYLVIWLALAIAPRYRDDWLLENILVFIGVPLVIYLDRRFSFSRLAALCLFIFLSLHAVGSHYTYSETPLFTLLSSISHLERNHFDRIVHFLFGFLLFVPLLDLFCHLAASARLRLVVTVLVLFCSSGIYEILEWLATEITHPELGIAFLGTQGDVWDAQKDMALAHLGSLLALLLWHKRARIEAG
jgi:putative membrane protein